MAGSRSRSLPSRSRTSRRGGHRLPSLARLDGAGRSPSARFRTSSRPTRRLPLRIHHPEISFVGQTGSRTDRRGLPTGGLLYRETPRIFGDTTGASISSSTGGRRIFSRPHHRGGPRSAPHRQAFSPQGTVSISSNTVFNYPTLAEVTSCGVNGLNQRSRRGKGKAHGGDGLGGLTRIKQGATVATHFGFCGRAVGRSGSTQINWSRQPDFPKAQRVAARGDSGREIVQRIEQQIQRVAGS